MTLDSLVMAIGAVLLSAVGALLSMVIYGAGQRLERLEKKVEALSERGTSNEIAIVELRTRVTALEMKAHGS